MMNGANVGFFQLPRFRVYDTSKDQDCIFEFSSSGERMLHSSKPTFHPTAPIVAWPLSPTKLVLACFGDEEDQVIQQMRPFSKGGESISLLREDQGRTN